MKPNSKEEVNYLAEITGNLFPVVREMAQPMHGSGETGESECVKAHTCKASHFPGEIANQPPSEREGREDPAQKERQWQSSEMSPGEHPRTI